MSYANPVFPSQSNVAPNMVAPYSNMAPQAVSPFMGKKGHVAPLATKSANAPHGCGDRVGGIYTSTGIILVLYILLVIILRAWC